MKFSIVSAILLSEFPQPGKVTSGRPTRICWLLVSSMVNVPEATIQAAVSELLIDIS